MVSIVLSKTPKYFVQVGHTECNITFALELHNLSIFYLDCGKTSSPHTRFNNSNNFVRAMNDNSKANEYLNAINSNSPLLLLTLLPIDSKNPLPSFNLLNSEMSSVPFRKASSSSLSV